MPGISEEQQICEQTMVDRTVFPLPPAGKGSNNSGGMNDETAVQVPPEQQLSVLALVQTPLAQHEGVGFVVVAVEVVEVFPGWLLSFDDATTAVLEQVPPEQHEGCAGVFFSTTGRMAAIKPGSGAK